MKVTAEKDEVWQQAIAVRGALSALRLSRITDKDVQVAKSRLAHWLEVNDPRWSK